MNYKEMKDYLFEKIRNHNGQRCTNVGIIVNMAMRIVATQRDRPQFFVSSSVATVDGQYAGYVINNPDIDVIKKMYITAEDQELSELPYEVMLDTFTLPSNYSEGVPTHFAVEKIKGAKADPSSASAVKIVSSSASDTTQIVRVVGISGGVRVQEEKTLTGTTGVSTTATFTEIYSIEKSARTVGAITVTSNADAVTNAVIAPDALSARYIYFRVHPCPDGVYTIAILAKRTIHPMVDDRDVAGDMWDEDFQNAILGVAESLILKDPSVAAVALNADKDNKRVQGSVGFRTTDRREYRTSLDGGRYKGS